MAACVCVCDRLTEGLCGTVACHSSQAVAGHVRLCVVLFVL